jgi:hypothetical protein
MPDGAVSGPVVDDRMLGNHPLQNIHTSEKFNFDQLLAALIF